MKKGSPLEALIACFEKKIRATLARVRGEENRYLLNGKKGKEYV